MGWLALFFEDSFNESSVLVCASVMGLLQHLMRMTRIHATCSGPLFLTYVRLRFVVGTVWY